MSESITDRDQALLELLKAHPMLRQRVEELLQIVEDPEGKIEKADVAEQRIIEEVRKLGHAALSGWAECQNQRIEDRMNQEKGVRSAGKKNCGGGPPLTLLS